MGMMMGRTARGDVTEAGEEGRDGAGRFAPARKEETVVVFDFFVAVTILRMRLGLRLRLPLLPTMMAVHGWFCLRAYRLRVARVGRGEAVPDAAAANVFLQQIILVIVLVLLLVVVMVGGWRRRSCRGWNLLTGRHCRCLLGRKMTGGRQ